MWLSLALPLENQLQALTAPAPFSNNRSGVLHPSPLLTVSLLRSLDRLLTLAFIHTVRGACLRADSNKETSGWNLTGLETGATQDMLGTLGTTLSLFSPLFGSLVSFSLYGMLFFCVFLLFRFLSLSPFSLSFSSPSPLLSLLLFPSLC